MCNCDQCSGREDGIREVPEVVESWNDRTEDQ